MWPLQPITLCTFPTGFITRFNHCQFTLSREEVGAVTWFVDPSHAEKGMFDLPCCFEGESPCRVNSSRQAEYVAVGQTSINGKCTTFC